MEPWKSVRGAAGIAAHLCRPAGVRRRSPGSGNLFGLWDQGDVSAARQWAETELGFSGTFPDQSGNLVFFTALAVLDVVPSLLGAWMLALAAGLVSVLSQDPFRPESVQVCQAVAGRCRLALSASLLLALGENLAPAGPVLRLSTLHFSLTCR